MTPKTPREIRADAVAVARLHASERDRDGDPEGAAAMRDLANSIGRIRLTKERR